jgi:membrane associated rhomboid family serine protease
MNSNQFGQVQIPMTPSVKWIMIATVAIWLFLQVIAEGYFGVPFSHYFALHPDQVIFNFFMWQPFSYMFLHTSSVGHILFNMLTLWFVGAELEQRWGKRFFVFYYFSSGVGAALFYCLGVAIYFLMTGNSVALRIPVLGASGSIFGLLLAYGLLFGERVIHFMMLFPMKAKLFVLILAGVELVSLLGSGIAGSEVANLAHLGGFLAGYLTLVIYTRLQRIQWRRQSQKGRKLRLVVDNENTSKTGDGPKYWN